MQLPFFDEAQTAALPIHIHHRAVECSAGIQGGIPRLPPPPTLVHSCGITSNGITHA